MTEPNRRVRRFIHILGTQRCMYFIEPPISWIRLTVHDSTLPPPIFPPLTLFNRQRGVLLVLIGPGSHRRGAEPRTPNPEASGPTPTSHAHASAHERRQG